MTANRDSRQSKSGSQQLLKHPPARNSLWGFQQPCRYGQCPERSAKETGHYRTTCL